MEGVPIISVDYRLSPEHKWPAALQDCLDAYLWLTSGSDEVIQYIGYKPENIIFTGDSAGGNLCLILSCLLNDIKKKLITFDEAIRKLEPEITFPSAIVAIYPSVNLKCIESPSRILSITDCQLTSGVLLSCLGCYLLDNESDKDMKKNTNWFIELCKTALSWLSN